MRQISILCALFGLIGGSFLQAEKNEEMVSNLVLIDNSLANVISLYEQVTGLDVVGELEYSYLISYDSRGSISEAQMVKTLEAMMELQGLELVKDGERVLLVRESKGQFYTGADPGVESRLPHSLATLRERAKQDGERKGILSSVVLEDESVAQVVNLLSNLLGEPILKGPGLRMSGKLNWEVSEITAVDAVIALDALLVEKGVFLVEEGGFVKVLIREPVNAELKTIEGVGLNSRSRATPLVLPEQQNSRQQVHLPGDTEEGADNSHKHIPRRRVIIPKE